MENVVSFKRWYYPVIARVIMDREIYYRTAIIERAREAPSFGYNEVEKVIFKVQNGKEWTTSSVKKWNDALEEIKRKVQEYTQKVESDGFFVTVRPLTKEVRISRQTIVVKRTSTAAKP